MRLSRNLDCLPALDSPDLGNWGIAEIAPESNERGKGDAGSLLRSLKNAKGEVFMIKSVGIDLGGIGEHKVRCLDERAQMCDGFSFDTTRAGLAKLEERVFSNGSNPVIIFEPTGLA